jgi:competence protein ComEC
MDSTLTFIAVVNDLPVQKKNSVKCELKLLVAKPRDKSKEHFEKSAGTVIAYFNGLAAKQLEAGQTVLIKSALAEVPSPKNPFEFDYRNYLYNKQIYHIAFIDSTSFTTLKIGERLHPIWKLGLNCKKYVLTQLKNSELSQNAYGICSALITGYDDEIDKQVMESFSHSGTLHVLSVSGLHTGLIYMVLNFLFGFVDRKNKYKITRFILITVLLWLFALITGFSAPVLRAVIMFNLFGIGRIWFRGQSGHQLNILLVSAFILLSYNPFYILDVGFLLSYFALFGLIWFQPKFSKYWQPSNTFLSYVWQSVTASIAATISTLPITLLCFKQFPLWFLVCNIVVVPATFVLLMLAQFIVLKMNFVAIIINYLVSGLLWFINLFNNRNSGFIDNIHFTFFDTLLLSLLIILLSAALYYKSYKQLAVSFIVLICWQLCSLVISYKIKMSSLFTVYGIKHQSALSLKNKTNVLLSIYDSDLTLTSSAHHQIVKSAHQITSTYNFHIKPHLISFNYPNINNTEFNFIKYNKGSILILRHQNLMPELDYKQVRVLVITNNMRLHENDLQKFTNLHTIILDSSNNRFTALYTEKLSRKFGIGFYNVPKSGAYLLDLG